MALEELEEKIGFAERMQELASAEKAAKQSERAHSAMERNSSAAEFSNDYTVKGKTKNWSAYFTSEGEARNLATEMLGSDPVEVEPNKWRNQDGKWRYIAKPGDVGVYYIHLEELNPKTGEVKQNLHLRWLAGASR
jgi:hypothetical protein